MTDLLKLQQLREAVSEHKPHIDKLLKIGPHLCELNPEEGEAMQEKYSKAEKMYLAIKEEVRKMAMALEDALAQASQVFYHRCSYAICIRLAFNSRLLALDLLLLSVIYSQCKHQKFNFSPGYVFLYRGAFLVEQNRKSTCFKNKVKTVEVFSLSWQLTNISC